MHDQIATTGHTGDLYLAKDNARQTVIKGDITQNTNPDAVALVKAITKAILEADADESLKAIADNVREQIETEVSKDKPKRETVEKLLNGVVALLPALAAQMPAWGEMLGRIFRG